MIFEVSANKKRIPILLIFGLISTGILFLVISRGGNGFSLFFYLPAIIILSTFVLIITILSFAEYLKTLFNKNAKLIISEAGIFDNLSIFSCGMIYWSEIVEVEISGTKKKSRVLIIKVSSSEKILRGKNYIIRYILKNAIKKWGSPVIVAEKRINFNLMDLKLIIEDRKNG